LDHLQEQAVRLRQMEEAMQVAIDADEQEQLLLRYGEAQETFDSTGGYSYEHRIRQVLDGLGFSEEDYSCPLARLSGGQQTRAQLAHLLLNEPDLLLLDEPTNHLDLDAVEWLEDYLHAWPGGMVIVAHDRFFLDQMVGRVWDLEGGELQHYRGNYSSYVEQRSQRRERQRRELVQQQSSIAHDEDFIRRNIAGERTKEAQGRRKRLERLQPVERVKTEKHIYLDLHTDLRSGDLVLATHDLVVGYQADAALFACPDLEIRRGDRVALLGPNGAGKTTFLRTILKEIGPLTGRVRLGAAVEMGYFAQAHAGLEPSRTVLDEILSVRNLPLGEARNYLGQFLFAGDDVFKPIAALSGGERARAALAKLALRGANFLILDEPTNHLDIPSQEILQSVLRGFPGTILLVSHDRYFIDALANQVWALEGNHLYMSKGGYSAYWKEREVRRVPGTGQAGTDGNGRPGGGRQEESEGKHSRRARVGGERKPGQYRRQREMAQLEQAIAAAETRLVELAAGLEEASQSQEVERVRELGQDYQMAEEGLGRLFERWAELEAK
ncbi:MAG: ABC-F family ATP-binding cassette domain-containing protein, partial [Ardenticatenia bacterium]|nr:ABC-F family ATP-binding cassette domain-containing protein [Ardenticatenia bacterium]